MSTSSCKSLRIRLRILVMLVFIPFIFIILFFANQQRNDAGKFAKDNSLRGVKNLAEQQQLIENSTFQFLGILSKLPDFENLDTLRLNKVMASYLNQNPFYSTLILVDSKGNLIASGLPYKKINVSDRKYFKEVMSTRHFAIGEYVRSRSAGKPLLHYAYPLMDKKGNVRMVLVAGFDLKYYDRTFNTSNLGDEAVFTFLDSKGVVIYHSPTAAISVGVRERPEILTKVNSREKESVFVAKGSDRILRVYAWKRMDLSPDKPYMYIFVGIPARAIYQWRGNELLVNVLVWFFALLLAVVASDFYARKFVLKPIDSLTGDAERILEGDIESFTEKKSSYSEIEKVTKALDYLTEKLQQREKASYKVEKELRKLKERFEFAINSANIGIWDWHVRNNTLIWDKNMFDLYGITAECFDANLNSWMQLLHKDDIFELENEIKQSIEYSRPFRSEFRINHPLFGLRNIRIFADVIKDKAGLPVRLIGVNWDITERKTLEGKLQEAKGNAEQSDRLKSAFLANISHEIRTPLHGIIGFAQIIRDNELTLEDRTQYLDIILSSGSKLMGIISNIIDVSLLDACELKLNEENVNLSSVVQKVYNNFEKQRVKDKNGFSFRLTTNFDTNLVIRMDGNRLSQILTNLIDNAFKFTHTGQVCFECTVMSNEVRFKVEDTGIVITRKDVTGIFEHFRQVDMDYNRCYCGNGLGLSICKGLVELMGGRIVVKSGKNGTAFCFNLPIRKAQGDLCGTKVFGNRALLS